MYKNIPVGVPNAALQPLGPEELAQLRHQQLQYAQQSEEYSAATAALGRMRSIATQSDFREMETQTTPWEPDSVVPASKNAKQLHLEQKYHTSGQPEVLYLKDLSFGDGLPAGLQEVRRIEKLREKRAFEAALPDMRDKTKMMLRRRLLTEWEAKASFVNFSGFFGTVGGRESTSISVTLFLKNTYM